MGGVPSSVGDTSYSFPTSVGSHNVAVASSPASTLDTQREVRRAEEGKKGEGSGRRI